MRSRTSEQFRNAFEKLPQHIQRNARKAFELWESDSTHPSLKFKQIHSKEQIYSVRIGLGWRAVGIREYDAIVWFWIGSHADYEKLITHL